MARNNAEDDHAGVSSPLTSLSPATSASPMPLLPSVDAPFTPVSATESDFKPAMSFTSGDDIPSMANSDNFLADVLSVGQYDKKEKDRNSSSAARATAAIGTKSPKDPGRGEYEEPERPPAHLGVHAVTGSPATANINGDDASAGISFLSPQSQLDSLSAQIIGSSFKPFSLPASPTGQQTQFINESVASAAAVPVTCTSASRKESDEPPAVVKPKPIIRTASTKSVSLRHPAPDITLPSSSKASSVAQLEAAAERLSTTSSIEDAIRELHDEQKRNDSRRSSILAASIASIPENTEAEPVPFPRQLSTAASSIVETNSAARSGGYSPAGFILSPTHSLRSNGTRLRSGSNPLSRPDSDSDYQFSRHGPGKSSTRSVRSATKPTLGDIAELPPTALTSAAMDAADQLNYKPHVDSHGDARMPLVHDDDRTPNQDYYSSPHVTPPLDYWDQAVADNQRNDERRPSHAGSAGTYDQAELAFADFDGAHCSPDVDFEDVPFMSQLTQGHTMPEPSYVAWDPELAAPEPLDDYSYQPPVRHSMGRLPPRPQSYMDPSSGNTMLFYPARVPMMLNLPQKLSKNPNAAARNKRRSEMLGMGPSAHNRQKSSSSWLPEIQPSAPLEDSASDGREEALTPQPGGQPLGESSTPPQAEEQSGPTRPQHLRQPSKLALNEDASKSRMSVLDTDKRHSRMPSAPVGNVPPQLRASAFFDMPSQQMPNIELKDGSAGATLDSILDASAKAPVSAFTDHAYAGPVGTEVWALDQKEQKRKSHAKNLSTATLEPKKRSSFLHLRKTSGQSTNKLQKEDRRNTIMAISPSTPSVKSHEEGSAEERQGLAASVGGIEHDEDARSSSDVDEDEGELMYNGPPTTLLAELQIRKQQNKMRTRPITQAHPNGMHSTLLELDTVADIQNRARKGKKINLAWEDPDAAPDTVSDDEDMPLALLLQTRNQGDDLYTAMADLNRPVGLIEQRDMEENEPLSRRRSRLQGRAAMPMHIARKSVMSLGASGLRMNQSNAHLGPPSPRLRTHTPEEDETEGETLRERMQRLKAQEEAENPLPKLDARPVSASFSAELLSQWGGDKPKEEEKPKPSATPEEEETLGQRRRRLQAEREARERELGQGAALAALTSPVDNTAANDRPPLRQRHSLADVLGSRGSRMVLTDPRADTERRRQEEAMKYQREQDHKMAAFRNQMPSNLTKPNVQQTGGFMSGQFNNGAGGMHGVRTRASMAFTGYHGNQSMGTGNAYGGNGAYGAPAYGVPAYGAGATPAYGGQMQTGNMDMVERWRQGVMP